MYLHCQSRAWGNSIENENVYLDNNYYLLSAYVPGSILREPFYTYYVPQSSMADIVITILQMR
jgi:hypothetical protein